MIVGQLKTSILKNKIVRLPLRAIILFYRYVKNKIVRPPLRVIILFYRYVKENILKAQSDKSIKIMFNSNISEINDTSIIVKMKDETKQIMNDLVYIFAGGELPTKFLQNSGVQISKRFGYIVKKHS